jgi:hypothetical protein
MQTSQPQPGWFLVACGIVAIAASLCLIAISVTACTRTWDPLSVIGGVILLPFPVTFCVQQYLALVAREAKAAWIAALMLSVMGAFTMLFAVTTMIEFVRHSYETPMTMMLIVVGIASGCLGVAWANYRWSRALGRSNATAARRPGRELLAAILGLAAAATLSVLLVLATPPRYAEHVEYTVPPFGIPVGATDISFCQGSRGTIAYEFAIDEAGFRRWVTERVGTFESNADRADLRPIREPFILTRYSGLTSELTGPDRVKIDRGFRFQWQRDDRGIYAAFDASANRAYYYFHSY